MKVARTVWSKGKDGDNFKVLPIAIYIISGLLWIVVFYMGFLFFSVDLWRIIKAKVEVKGLEIGIVIVSAYIVGNIMRPTEIVLKEISEFIWGDFYKAALYPSEKSGLFKLKSLREPTSEKIKENIREKRVRIKVESKVKIEIKVEDMGSSLDEFLLLETYINLKKIQTKATRVGDLASFFESIYLPINILSISIIFYNIDIGIIELTVVNMILFLLLNCLLLNRYKYLKSNYIKETYRIFYYEKIGDKK